MNSSPRTIVLTGVTRGLGRALLDGFADTGETVVGCGRDAAALAELQTQYPAPHRFDQVDIGHDDQVAAWAAQVLASHGPPDLLVCNAAVINPNAPLWEVPADEFAQVMQVNICGTASLVRHFVPAMLPRAAGTIVGFSSGWGRSTSPEVAPYCASKWAIEGLMQALAQELPDGMAAVPLNPGVINTEMLQSCFGSHANMYPTPEQWAQRAVPFLLSLGPRHNGEPETVPGF